MSEPKKTTHDNIQNLKRSLERCDDAQRCASKAEANLRRADDAHRAARQALRDYRSPWRQVDKEHEETLVRAADKAEAEASSAHDAYEKAHGEARAAADAYTAMACDPSLALDRVAHFQAIFDERDAEHAKAEAARVATHDELTKAEQSFGRHEDAFKRAREEFDEDPSKRPAYVKAMTARDDASHDVERARRRASEATAAATTTAEAREGARAALAREMISPGTMRARFAPLVDRQRKAYRDLLAVHVDHGVIVREMHSIAQAELGDMHAASLPTMWDLKRKALEALRIDLVSKRADATDTNDEQTQKALSWVER